MNNNHFESLLREVRYLEEEAKSFQSCALTPYRSDMSAALEKISALKAEIRTLETERKEEKALARRRKIENLKARARNTREEQLKIGWSAAAIAAGGLLAGTVAAPAGFILLLAGTVSIPIWGTLAFLKGEELSNKERGL